MNGARLAQPPRSGPALRRSGSVSPSAYRPRVSVMVRGKAPALDPDSEGAVLLILRVS